MGISPYLHGLRAKVGNDLLMVPAAVAILFDDDSRALIARDASTGQWMAIGGAIDPDETPARAAVRECLEESGLIVEPVRLIGVFGGPEFRFTYPNGDQVSFIVTAFEVRRQGGELRPDGSEVAELRFVSLSEVSDLEMASFNKLMLRQAFERGSKPFF